MRQHAIPSNFFLRGKSILLFSELNLGECLPFPEHYAGLPKLPEQSHCQCWCIQSPQLQQPSTCRSLEHSLASATLSILQAVKVSTLAYKCHVRQDKECLPENKGSATQHFCSSKSRTKKSVSNQEHDLHRLDAFSKAEYLACMTKLNDTPRSALEVKEMAQMNGHSKQVLWQKGQRHEKSMASAHHEKALSKVWTEALPGVKAPGTAKRMPFLPYKSTASTTIMDCNSAHY